MPSDLDACYRAFFETTLDGILIVDDAGTVIDVNESLCRILKAPREQLLGKPLSDFVPRERLAAADADFSQLKRGGTFSGEFPLRAADGSMVELEWSSRAHFVPGLHLHVARDITERRRAEKEAERQRQWLKTTLASIGDAVIATDEKGRVTFLNEVAERLTGWTQVEAEARPLTDVFQIVNEATRKPVTSPVEKVLQSGAIVGLANHTVLIARNGKEYAIDDSAAPIRDQAGAVGGVVLIFRDITDRRRLEIAAHRLAAIVASSDDAIVGKDLNGIVTSWNQAAERIFGYSVEEMVGQPIARLVPPERPNEEPEILERLRQGKRIDHFETVRMRKDGTRVDISVTISPIKDEEGRIVGASKVARDITREKVLRSELEQRVAELAEADRRKDHFLAMLAHELRNPLGAITNAVHVLQQPQGSEATKQRAVQVLRRQVRHQAHLVNELLDVSRITRGLIELHPEPLDLVRLVRDVAEDFRVALEQERITLQLELPESPVWVRGDAMRLAQVTSNLLSNALKFTTAGGRVSVGVEAGTDPSRVALTVRDTGIGIEPELLPHVFDSFSQGDRTLARSHGGLGLGLTIVQGLVGLHGGTVSAESAGQGQGTTVRVLLPQLQTRAEAARDSSAPRSEDRALRVLVVEDHQDAAEMLKEILEMNGYEVVVALSGPEGVQAARECRPDVVLCDIGLPGMDGYEVAMALRTLPGGARQRLVAVTGYGQDEDRRRSREAGFQYHLVKPIDPEELREVLLTLADDMAG